MKPHSSYESKRPQIARVITKVVIGISLVAFVCLVISFGAWRAYKPTRDWERAALAMIGMPEIDFIKKFGQPRHVVSYSTLAGRSVDYPWKAEGLNYVPIPDHPVRNKVLLYQKLNIVIYVFLDDGGIVEHVAVGGT